MSVRRAYLGGDRDMGSRRKVFLLEDAIEVDEIGFTDIERTRVFFDDALALTYHREFGVGFLFATGIMGGFMTVITLIIAQQGGGGGAMVFFLLFGLPFLLAFVIRIALRVDVITLYGNRSRARMKFSFRKQRARDIYRDLSRGIKRKQAQIAASLPPPPPPVEPPLPPGPGAIPS